MITKRRLHRHIDTLYLSYRCIHELEYNSIVASCINADLLGTVYSAGISYYIYKFDGYRLKVATEWDILQKMPNRYHCEIQYEHNALFHYDPYLLASSLPLPFSLDLTRYIIKRLDYNITFNNVDDFDYLDSGYISKYFRGRWDTIKNTIYFGDRKSSNKLFRIYNKTKELLERDSAVKYDMLLQYFGSGNGDNLITAEIELKRDYIRDSLDAGNGSLCYLKEIVHDAASMLSSIEVFPLNDANKNKYKHRNYKRLDSKRNLVDLAENNALLHNQIQYKPSIHNLATRLTAMKKDFEKRLGREIAMEELATLMISGDKAIQEISIEFKE